MGSLLLRARPRHSAGSLRATNGLRAFTLIELLVTITIIALLLAMFMPIVQVVREAGREAVCRSSMRQLYFSAMAYADDNDGLCVSPYRWNGNAFWMDILAPWADAQKTGGGVSQHSVLWGCPDRRDYGNMNQGWVTGYGINKSLEQEGNRVLSPGGFQYTNAWNTTSDGTFCSDGWWGWYRPAHIGRLTYPGSRAWWGENTSWTIDLIDTYYPAGQSTFTKYRHRSHNNAVFIDGHVQGLKKTTQTMYCVNDPAKFAP